MEYRFDTNNFNEEVLNSDIPVMIDFYADWCGPCKRLGPTVEKLADEYDGKVKIGKVNVDENPDLASQYGVMSIPNLVFLRDGKPVDQVVGLVPASTLKQKLDEVLE